MTGRFGGIRNALVQLLMLGALGLVVALSALGRENEDGFKAAPDDPDHAQTCEVCRSPNHFGGLMPGPAPSAEVLNRMFSEEAVSETLPDFEGDEWDTETDAVETASDRKLKSQPDYQKPTLLQPRTSARKPSAS